MKTLWFNKIGIMGCLLMALSVTTQANAAVPIIYDDLYVEGNIAIGNDSVLGENFGDDTLRLKENNTRIYFNDTNGQDWWLIANDSGNGGRSFLAISDFTAMYEGTRLTGVPYSGSGPTYTSYPDQLDFRVDPSNNTFHITNERIIVSTSDNLRFLSNVEDGLSRQDVATFGQLYAVKLQHRELQTSATPVTQEMLAAKDQMDATATTVNQQQNQVETLEDELSTTTTQLSTIQLAASENRDLLAQNAAAADQISQQVSGHEQELAQLNAMNAMTGDDGVTFNSASTTGEGSTALGSGASARTLDTAIGYRATATADNSVALGAQSLVASENSVAAGADSSVQTQASGSVALGQGAAVSSQAENSVALGQDAVADERQTVSVGNAHQQRRVTHVADGVAQTDAVTLRQLHAVDSWFMENNQYLQDKVDDLDDDMDDMGALAVAFSALIPNARAQGNTQVSLGVGHYSGANALAAGLFHYLADNILVKVGVSSAFDRDSTAVQTGVSLSW